MNFKKRIMRSLINGAAVKKQVDAAFEGLETCPYSEEHIHELARRIHAGEPRSLSDEEALQIVNLSAALRTSGPRTCCATSGTENRSGRQPV